MVWQSEVLKEPLNAGMGIATSGNHKTGLDGSHVQSTRPWRPAPINLWWKDRLCCRSNLRSSTTLDSVCTRPEFEETKFESKDTMGFADEEYPSMNRDTLLRLLPELAVE